MHRAQLGHDAVRSLFDLGKLAIVWCRNGHCLMWLNCQVPTAIIAEANPGRGQNGAIGPRAEVVAGQTDTIVGKIAHAIKSSHRSQNFAPISLGYSNG
jgi:hypothetical protein